MTVRFLRGIFAAAALAGFCGQDVAQASGWWAQFGDATLDSLMTIGIDRNYDLSMAARRVAVARNSLGAARSAYYPTLGLNAGWSKSQTSGRISPEATRATSDSYFSLGATMSWEVDIFGRITAGVKGSEASYKASHAEYEAAMLSIEAQIMTAYATLVSDQAQLALARRHAEEQERVVKLTEARKEAGIGNALEVSQAKVVLYSTLETIPQIECSVVADRNALAVLLGAEPGTLMLPDAASAAFLDSYAMLIPDDVPAELVSRRPDVEQARLEAEAAAASLGVAKRDYLPALTVSGSISTDSHNIKNLFGENSMSWSVAPTLSWTMFDGFKRSNNVQSARQQAENAMDNYHLTLLNALTEASNALASYQTTVSRIASLQQAVEQSRRARELSLDLYKQGLTTFTNVVDAQIDLLRYENSLIAAKAYAITALADLYKSLGGEIQ